MIVRLRGIGGKKIMGIKKKRIIILYSSFISFIRIIISFLFNPQLWILNSQLLLLAFPTFCNGIPMYPKAYLFAGWLERKRRKKREGL